MQHLRRDLAAAAILLLGTVSGHAQGKPLTQGKPLPAPSSSVMPPVELTITASRPDQVEIDGFGVYEDVDPDFPARVDVLANEPGRYPVRLVEGERTIATLDVSAYGARGGSGSEARSSDSPGSSTAASTSGASSAS